MLRNLPIACLLALAPASAGAQELVESTSGYRARLAAEGLSEDLSTTTGATLVPAEDGAGVLVPIGFGFPYFEEEETTVGITAEGYLLFNGQVLQSPRPFPDPVAPNGVIAPLWADLAPSSASRIHFLTLGNAPARRLIVQWTDYGLASAPDARLTFQAVLYEQSGTIELRYGEVQLPAGAEVGVGVEDQQGALGLDLNSLFPGGTPQAGESVRIVRGPPQGPRISVRSAVAGPGNEVEIPIDVSGDVRGVRGLQATLRLAPLNPAHPDLLVRALEGQPGSSLASALEHEPPLASRGPLRFVLPVQLPAEEVVPSEDAPASLARLKIVVPETALAGATYRLLLEDVILAGNAGEVPVTSVAGTLTIRDATPPGPVLRLEISAPPSVSEGGGGELEVIALGAGGAPLPGVEVALDANSSAISLSSSQGTTDDSGRLRVAFSGTSPGLAILFASSPGLGIAEREVSVLAPTPPVIVSDPPLLAWVGVPYAYQPVTDPSGGAIELVAGPPNMTLAPDGTLSWVPTFGQVGVHTITLGIPNTTSIQRFELRVSEPQPDFAPNQAPTITSAPASLTLTVGETFEYTVVATDPDGDPLTYRLEQLPAGMTITSNVVHWTPTADQVGEQRALVVVSDDRGAFDGKGYVFTVQAVPDNGPPVIVSTPPTDAVLGQPIDYDVEATDPESEPLTYELLKGPRGMVIDANSGLLSWIPPSVFAEILLPDERPVVDSITTVGGYEAGVVNGRFIDPPGLTFGQQTTSPNTAYSTNPYAFGWQTAPPPPVPNRKSDRDFEMDFVNGPGQLIYDLGGLANKVVVFPFVDGVVPREGVESTVLLSNDGRNWVTCTLEKVYRLGWHPDPNVILDEYVCLHTAPAGETYRFAQIIPEGPAALPQGTGMPHAEIDAVAGLREDCLGLGDIATEVTVRVQDPAGNFTTQTFVLNLRGEPVIAAHPNPVDFGEVSVGQRVRRRVSLENVGSGDLRAETAEVVSAATGPFEARLISAGGSLPQVEVTFQPASVGTVTSAVLVTADGTSFTLPIRGAGVSEARPAILSHPQLVAVTGQEYRYAPSGVDPAGGGLAYAVRSGPANASVPSPGTVLRWVPTPEELGYQRLELVATDINGAQAIQVFEVLVVEPSVEVRVRPSPSQPGRNLFEVEIEVDVSPLDTVVLPGAFGQDPVVVRHVIPSDWELLEVSTGVLQDVQTSEGRVLVWKRGFNAGLVKYVARSPHLVAGTRAMLSASTEVRVLGVGSANLPPGWEHLRQIPSQTTNPQGITLAPVTSGLQVVAPEEPLLRSVARADGALLRTDPASTTHNAAATYYALESTPDRLFMLDQRGNRFVEATPDGATTLRTTRTDGFARVGGFAHSLTGMAVDPTTGRPFFAGADRLYVHTPHYGKHDPLDTGSPAGVAYDPARRERWVVGALPPNTAAYRYAEDGTLLSSFALPLYASGATFDVERDQLLISTGSVVYRYERDGTLVSQTNASWHTLSTGGISLEPDTGALWLTSDKNVVRLGPQFGRHVTLPGNPRGLALEPNGMRWSVDPFAQIASRVDPQGQVLSSFPIPTGVVSATFDSDRNQLVTLHGGRIYRFSETGEQVGTARTDGLSSGLAGIAYESSSGRLWLLDAANERLLQPGSAFGTNVSTPGNSVQGLAFDPLTKERWVFDSSSNLAYRTDAEGTVLSSFAIPTGVTGATFDPDRRELVSTYSGRVRRHDLGGALLSDLRTDNYITSQAGVAREPGTGALWFVNGLALVRLDPRFGESGPAPTGNVQGIAYDQARGERWFVDASLNQVLRADAQGNVQFSFPIPTQGSGLAYDPSRDQLLVSFSNHWLRRYARTGELVAEAYTLNHVSGPTGVELDAQTEEIYLLGPTSFVRLGKGFARDTFFTPTASGRGLALDPATGDRWIADFNSGASRAIQLSASGEELSSFAIPAGVQGAAWDAEHGELLTQHSSRLNRYGPDGSLRGNNVRTDYWGNIGGIAHDGSQGYWLMDTSARSVAHVGSGLGRTLPLSSNLPTALTIKDGEVYYVDNSDRWIYRLTESGSERVLYAGLVSTPVGLVVGDDGGFQVLSRGTRRLYAYSASGTFLRSTRVDYMLPTPTGLGQSPTGRLIATDTTYAWAVRFAPSFGQHDPAPASNPTGVAASAGGRTWVLDGTTRYVYERDASGAAVQSFYVNQGSPQGIAYDPAADELWVLDTGGTVDRYSSSGTFISRYVNGAITSGARGIAMVQGRLFVCGGSTQEVAEIDPATGARIGGFSTVPLGATSPSGLSPAPNGTDLLISDVATDRVYQVTLGGTSVQLFSTAALGAFTPSGVAAIGSEVYMTDSGEDRVFRATMLGAVEATFSTSNTSTGLSVSPAGEVFVVNSTGDLSRYSADGTLLRTISTRAFGSFYPTGVAHDGQGRLVVSDASEIGKLFRVPDAGVAGLGVFSLAAASGNLTGITLGPDGSICVSASSGSIYRFQPDGTLIGTTSTSTYGLGTPLALAYDGQDFLVQEADRYTVVAPEGLASAGYGVPAGFGDARGIALDSDGNVHLAGQGGAFVVISPSDGYLRSYSGQSFGSYAVHGLAAIGSEVLVANATDDRVFQAPFGGLPVRSFSHGAYLRPSGLTFGPDGNLRVLDGTFLDSVTTFDTTGVNLGSFPVTASGSFGPTAIAYDDNGGFLVGDATEDQVLLVPAGGLQSDSISVVGYFNPAGLSGLCLGPEDTLCVTEAVNDSVTILRRDGSVERSVPTRSVGSLAPTGVAFDGENFLIADGGDGELYELDPEGLERRSFSVDLGGASPAGLTYHSSRQTLLVLYETGGLAEYSALGQYLSWETLNVLGVYGPRGVTVQEEGDLFVVDQIEDRIYSAPARGSAPAVYELEDREIPRITGLAFDPVARHLFMTNNTSVFEVCATPTELTVISTLELSLFEVYGAVDVAVDREAEELYVLTQQGPIEVFRLWPYETETPARILLVGSGDVRPLALALQAWGHQVEQVEPTPGALAGALSVLHDEVWFFNNYAPDQGATLSEDDLRALEDWRVRTGRTSTVMDLMAWRNLETCSSGNLARRLSDQLARAGGGILVGAGPQLSGSRGGVAVANQVLDRLGFRALSGHYRTQGSALSTTSEALVQGLLPVGLATLVGEDIEHAYLPLGFQPNGQELGEAASGSYVEHFAGEEIEGQLALLASTIEQQVARFVHPPVYVDVLDVLEVTPSTANSVAGGTALYSVRVSNVGDLPASYVLSLEGLPPEVSVRIPGDLQLEAGESRALLVSLTLPADFEIQTRTLSFRLDEVEESGTYLRQSLERSLVVVGDAPAIPVSLDPPTLSVAAGGTDQLLATIANPSTARAPFRLDTVGLALLGSAPITTEVWLDPAESVQVAIPLDLLADPATYQVGVRVSSPALRSGQDSSRVELQRANLAPIAEAGPARVVPSLSGSATLVLDARGSFDPDGGLLTYRWSGPGAFDDPNSPLPAVTLAEGTHELSLEVSDGLLTATDTVTVTVGDSEPPVLGPFPPQRVEQESLAGTPVEFELAVSDDSGSFATQCTHPSGSTFPLGETTVTCMAADGSGNVGNTQFVVRVVDTTPPTFAPYPDVVIQSVAPVGTIVSFATPTASDLCDVTPSVECSPPAGAFFPLGDTLVTSTATDDSGNVSSMTFLVRVQAKTDNTPPQSEVVIPSEGQLLAQPDVAVQLTWQDELDGSGVDPTSLLVTIDGADVSDLFAITTDGSGATATLPGISDGPHALVASVADTAGNRSGLQPRSFVVDTTPPVIVVEGAEPVIVEQSELAGTAAQILARAEDVIDPAPSLEASGPAVFPLGETSVTLRATDAAGNVSTRVVLVRVVDTTPPVIAAHADLLVEQTALAGTAVLYSGSATDICDAAPALTYSPPSGSVFPLGQSSVTVTATDASGNSSQTSFQVTVQDTTPPLITVPPIHLSVEATVPGGAVVTYPPIGVADACDATPVVACNPPSGSTLPVGETLVQCLASDVSGNARPTTFRVTVTDTGAPSIPQPPNLTAEQDSPAGATVTFPLPAASDAVDPNPSVICVPASGSVFPPGVTTVTCTATDASGNSAQTSFTVTVADTTAPVLERPADLAVEQTSPAGATVGYSAPAASDAADPSPIVVCTPASGSVFPAGETTVTCVATDAAGNSAQVAFTVTVADTAAPVLTQPADLTVEQTIPAGATVTYAVPSASDSVDPAPNVVCTPASGSVFPAGVTAVTCVATDAAGNSAQVTFTVTVADTAAPVLTQPVDLSVEQTSPAGATVTYTAPTASDSVDPAPTVVCTPASGSVFPAGETTVTCVATDAGGNSTQVTFTVTVADTTPPAIAQLANLAVEQTSPAGATVTYAAPTVSDAADPSPSVVCSPASGSVFPAGVTAVTCVATDAAGNSAQATFTVTVADTAAPVLTQPADLTVEQTSSAGATVSYTLPSASDAADPAPSVVCTPASGSVFPGGETLVTCVATDAAGNSAQVTFTVTVADTTAPALTQPANLAVEQTSPSGVTVTYAVPAASDAVDPAPSVVCTPASGSVFPAGGTLVTCVATDAAGNSAQVTFTVTVADTTAPALAQPADLTVEQTSSAGATVSYTLPSASDAADPAPSVVCTPASGSVFAPGETLVTCVATDRAGNNAQVTFTVTVADTTAPALAQPPDLTVEQTSPAGAAVSYTLPSASDAADPAPRVVCTPASGSVFPGGETLVTCVATDAAGNSAQVTFTITVADTTAPTLAQPVDLTVEQASPAGATVSYAPPAASDLVDSAPSVVSTPASGSVFAPGETLVTCVATDAVGNSAQVTFTVTVADTTAPTLAQPADLTVEQSSPAGAAVSYATPAASDSVDPTPTVVCTPASGSVFPAGETLVTCGATDAAGNSAEVTFRVTVADTTAPTLAQPADLTVEQTSLAGATVSYPVPAASDAGDPAPSVVCTPASGSVFAPGETLVTCVATDSAGNSAQVTFTVTVADTTAPTLAQPAGLTVEQSSPAGASVTYAAPAASDAADPAPSVVCTPASGSVFPAGETTVTCVATDAAGNSAQATFTVTVADTTAPTLAQPADLTVEQTSPAGATVSFAAPDASDAADPAPSVVCTPASGSVFPAGATTVTCVATDAAGNSAQATFTVTVADTTAPTLAQPADLTVEQTSPAGATVTYAVPAASDSVDPAPTVVCTPASGSDFPAGETTVTCVATDAAGNRAQATFTVTVADTAAPVLTQPADLTVEQTSPAGATVSYAVPSASDAADPAPSIVCTPASGSVFPAGETTVTCVATDAAGNRAQVAFSVTVVDTLAPVLAQPADLTVEQTSPAGATVSYGAPSVSDAADPAPTVVCTPASGSLFAPGQTTVTCVATDAAGNSAQVTFTVTVADTTAPSLAQPADLTLEQTSTAGAEAVFSDPAISDQADPSPTLSCDPPSGTTLPLGETTVTCTATDAEGNSAQVTFVVTVVDTTPPALALLADLELEQSSLAGAPATWSASASDVCDATPGVVCVPPSGTVFPLGETEVLCTARDASGNESERRFLVRVVDTQSPTLSCPTPLRVSAHSGTPVTLDTPEVAAWVAQASATDVCDASPTIDVVAPATFPAGATTPVTFRARDASGNEATCVVDLTVEALQLEITAPDEGSCQGGPVTVTYQASPGLALSVTGSRTLAGQSYTLPGGLTFSEPGDYVVALSAGGGSDTVRFSIDTIAPSVSVASPLAVPHPSESYPYNSYRYTPPIGGQPNAASELPIALGWSASDADGVSGEVVSRRVLLDGQLLPLDTSTLDVATFCQAGLPLLGRHVLRVEARDCAGNLGVQQVAFEIALIETEGAFLTIKAESLQSNGGVLTAFLTLPTTPTGCPLDGTYADVVASTLQLTALATGETATPTKVQVNSGAGRLQLKFRRDDLTKEGCPLGTRFRLTGRFFSTSGAVFVFEDEVKKSPGSCKDKGCKKDGCDHDDKDCRDRDCEHEGCEGGGKKDDDCDDDGGGSKGGGKKDDDCDDDGGGSKGGSKGGGKKDDDCDDDRGGSKGGGKGRS